MIGVLRHYINIDWLKMKEKYSSITKSHIWCLQNKLNPFREDWDQGFDSDCCCGHCIDTDLCLKAFTDKELHLDNHMKTIIVPFEKKPHGFPKIIEIGEI